MFIGRQCLALPLPLPIQWQAVFSTIAPLIHFSSTNINEFLKNQKSKA